MTPVRMASTGGILFTLGALFVLGALPVEVVAALVGAGVGLLVCAAHEAIIAGASRGF